MNVTKFFQSQSGEDRFLFEKGLIPADGTYIDVGSAHPVINSNTYFLDVMGWRGWCFEPDEAWHPEYEYLRSERCTLVKSAVGAYDGECGFKTSRLHELSKIDPTSTDKLPITRLDSFMQGDRLNSTGGIDLLSIDVEGFELEVLKGCGLLITPKIIIIEYNTLVVVNNDALQYCIQHGYNHIHSTDLNHILTI